MIDILLAILAVVIAILIFGGAFIAIIYISALKMLDVTNKQFMTYVDALSKFQHLSEIANIIQSDIAMGSLTKDNIQDSNKTHLPLFMIMAERCLDALEPIPSSLYENEAKYIDNVRDTYSKLNLMRKGFI